MFCQVAQNTYLCTKHKKMKENKRQYDMPEDTTICVSEPIVDMDSTRTKSFIERHDKPTRIEEAVPLKQGFNAFRERLRQKYHAEENRIIS